MQKVYLLLRNNCQTGPFTTEELLQFNLTPFDLIWIEGKSAGWYYPQEIRALQPHLPFVKKVVPEPVVAHVPSAIQTQPVATTAKKIFVSLPVAQPQQAAIKPATDAAPEMAVPQPAGNEAEEAHTIKTTYRKSLHEAEADYTTWMYKQKTTKKPLLKKRWMVACLVTGVAFAGWWAVKEFSGPTVSPMQEQTSLNAANGRPLTDSIQQNPAQEGSSVAVLVKKRKAGTVNEQLKPAGSQQKATATIVQSSAPLETNTAPANTDYEAAATNKDIAPSTPEAVKNEPVAEAPKEKKKLRDKFFELFKKKPDAKSDDETTDGIEGERRTTRREGDANLAQLVNVRFTIPNEWMMGVKGAKATLNNRSSEIVGKATAEVLYYNDDNELLDTKTVVFKNVSAKNSQTVSIPDHATATRLEYKIVSVTAAEPYARL